MELVILPFFIPLMLLGRFIDVWQAWRGQRAAQLQPASEEDWAQTWGQMLKGEARVQRSARRT